MKIVICIKAVKSELVYPNVARVDDFVINPYDLYALEKTVGLKRMTDCQIICLCMGPKSAISVLQKAIAIGADDAVMLCDDVFRGSDTVATSYLLAKAIKKIGNVDFVVCGKRAIDGETGQVVYGISERLGYFCVPELIEILSVEEDFLTVKQANDSEIAIGKLKTPAVAYFNDLLITQPKVSLMGLKKARKKELTHWNAEDLQADVSRCGLDGSKTKVLNVQKEVLSKEKSFLEGSTKEKVKLLYQLIAGKTGISK